MTASLQNQDPAEGAVIDLPVAVAAPALAPPITVDLRAEEQDVGQASEALGFARVFALKADAWSRIVMVLVIAMIFVGLNWLVLAFLNDAFRADLRLLEAKPPLIQPVDRLITTQLLMTLIGATVVQVGVSIAAIVSYLFPKNSRQDGS